MVDNPVSQNKKYENGSQGRQYSLTQPSSPSSTLRSSRQIYENSRSVPRWYIFEKWCFNTIEVFPSLEKYFSTDHNLTGLTRGLIAGKGRSGFLGTKVEESSTKFLFWDLEMILTLTSGHGSLSSLVSLGHLSSVSHQPDDRAALEIQVFYLSLSNNW